MTSKDIRQKYLDFFKARKHVEIKPARIVLDSDQTTLFTSSGMQPLIPYLLGKNHPEGIRLVNSQPAFRSGDIEEVGDNRHTTFFEMLGNWSLGDYFKKEQLDWFYQFLTEVLELDPERLHVTYFKGDNAIPKDSETFDIWKSLGIPEDNIYSYGIDKNWWSKSGTPDNMPVGEIGGVDSEVFYEFPAVLHDKKFGEVCYPHCDCGRFLEIGNSVFIEYKKTGDNAFEKLPQKNVDFGGGLERLTAATNNEPDIFKIDIYQNTIKLLEEFTSNQYSDHSSAMQVIADHMRAAVALIADGVRPSNKLHGYILRRLLRRSAVKMRQLGGNLIKLSELTQENQEVIREEMERFSKTLDTGLKEIEKIENIDGKIAFNLYQTFGFPYEVTEEIFREKGQDIDKAQFTLEFKKHKELSRTASVGMFKGGLAGHSEIETKYHTATHLLHQALRDVLGSAVFQKGSNITPERLRFDFSFDRKMSDEEIKTVENLVNFRIKEDLLVERKFMSVDDAKKLNAIGLFNEKYGEEVSIYLIGPNFKSDPEAAYPFSESKDQRDRGGYYSAEFCGGPHVERTGIIGEIQITKEEAVSSGIRRMKAKIC